MRYFGISSTPTDRDGADLLLELLPPPGFVYLPLALFDKHFSLSFQKELLWRAVVYIDFLQKLLNKSWLAPLVIVYEKRKKCMYCTTSLQQHLLCVCVENERMITILTTFQFSHFAFYSSLSTYARNNLGATRSFTPRDTEEKNSATIFCSQSGLLLK